MSDGGTESHTHDATGTEWSRRPVESRRRWLAVARKDFADAGRSWQLYVLTAVFTVAMSFGAASPVLSSMARDRATPVYSATDGLVRMAEFTEFIVPLVVLMLGHMAIAGQSERGSLRTLLALPVSRRDVVLGTVVGRTAVVGTALAVGLSVSGVLMWVFYDGFGVLTYVGFSASILAFAACFVAMAVGISAASPTRGHALTWAVSAFGVTTFLWGIFLFLVKVASDVTVVVYNSEPNRAPGWFVFLDRAHPGTAMRHVVSNWIVPVFPGQGIGGSSQYPRLTNPGPEPFYLDAWFLALVVLAWGLVPLAVGYWRFRDAEVV